jgi:hypothetical protein
MDKELSDLKLQRKECPKCHAVWINGSHIWSGTGNKGSEVDLAGLVCNNLGDDSCINPQRGQDGGDSWEKRLEDITKMLNERLGDNA